MLTEEQLLAAPDEEYMNEAQLAFFRNLLQEQADEVRAALKEARETLTKFENEPDELDKASIEEERRMNLRFLDRLLRSHRRTHRRPPPAVASYRNALR